MKIAQVAPLYESVPPKLYGGTERVVSFLTEELVREGHEVDLFASGDSITQARLRPMCNEALRLQGKKVIDPLACHIRMIELALQEAKDYDVVHFHVDYLHFPMSRREAVTAVTTLHGRLDIPELRPLYEEFTDVNLVSISNAQRRPISWANWVATVHHGLPARDFEPCYQPGKYLAFLGRICADKGIDQAIEIAKKADMPLKIAAKVDAADQEYFESSIRKLLDHSLVEFVGEIGDHEKSEFLGNALALLFPINWPEPFGLAMIESMACGTPVIAYPRGSVPEVVDKRTGFIVHNAGEATEAIAQASSFDRHLCRRVFEERFTARRMCRDYLKVYKRLAGGMSLEPRKSASSSEVSCVA